MNLIDTLDFFIESLEGDLEGISWQIREETNFEDNSIDFLSEQYDSTEEHLNNLIKIKSIIKCHENDPIQMILNDPDDSLCEKIANAMQQASIEYDS
jgi:hypothetical protein